MISQIEILDAIHYTLQSPVMDGLSFAFEYVFKTELIWIILALWCMRNPGRRKYGTILLLALIIEMCITYPLKYAFMDPRPYEVYDVPALITNHVSPSFPSSHAASTFCAATVTALFYRKRGLWLIGLAILVSVTRMYMYAHWPQDVLVGMLIGVGSAFYIFFLCLRWGPETVFGDAGRDPEDDEVLE